MNEASDIPDDGAAKTAAPDERAPSETSDVIRIAAVAGPLVIGLLIALYLVLGSGGLIGRSGSSVAAFGNLALFLIPIVLGGFAFLFKRHWLDASKRWCLLMPVAASAAATLLGFVLALSVHRVDFSSSAPNQLYQSITTALQGIPANTVTDIVTKAYDDAVPASQTTTTGTKKNGLSASKELPARAEMIRSISTDIVSRFRNTAAVRNAAQRQLASFGSSVTPETIDAIQATADAPEKPRSQRIRPYLPITYDMLASILVGLSLAILLFVPDSVRRLVRPTGAPNAEPAHEEPPLSVYFGFVFGILLYLVGAYIFATYANSI